MAQMVSFRPARGQGDIVGVTPASDNNGQVGVVPLAACAAAAACSVPGTPAASPSQLLC